MTDELENERLLKCVECGNPILLGSGEPIRVKDALKLAGVSEEDEGEALPPGGLVLELRHEECEPAVREAPKRYVYQALVRIERFEEGQDPELDSGEAVAGCAVRVGGESLGAVFTELSERLNERWLALGEAAGFEQMEPEEDEDG